MRSLWEIDLLYSNRTENRFLLQTGQSLSVHSYDDMPEISFAHLFKTLARMLKVKFEYCSNLQGSDAMENEILDKENNSEVDSGPQKGYHNIHKQFQKIRCHGQLNP